jgi:Cof subfamily protein (haloacid dehalogenase superfamily)
MRYTSVAIDIDGTLINNQKVVPAFTRSEIRRVQAEGATLVFASSRMPRSVRKVMAEVGVSGHVVAYNGARVEVEGEFETLHDDPMSEDVLQGLLLGAADLSTLHTGLFFGDHWAVSSLDYWALREARTSQTWPDTVGLGDLPAEAVSQGLHKIMLRGDAAAIDKALVALDRFGDALSVYRPKGNIVEVTSAKSVKSEGILMVLNAIGGDVERLIAFGDNLNDTEMLREAALGIAVANAPEELIEVADEVTLSNDEDGVGYALRKHFPSSEDDFRP